MGARGKTAAGLFVVIGSSAVAVPASAHSATYPTDVAMTFDDREPLIPVVQPDEPDTFSGQLSSPRDRCEAGRLVRVYRRLPGGGRRAVASTTSASDGSWSAAAEDPPDGTYFATVSWILFRADGPHCHYCASGRSNNLAVENS